mmetsp:Transcript_75412/g.214485  ORF Transcript_75412/g.214485 Transcript_75412/m.214485 type:complete len:129 (-) Transcript_75412:484-870(-)
MVVHFFAALARSADATIQQVALEVGGQRVALHKLRAVSEHNGSQSLDSELDLAKLGEAVRVESARVLKVSQGRQRITNQPTNCFAHHPRSIPPKMLRSYRLSATPSSPHLPIRPMLSPSLSLQAIATH